MYNAGCTYPRAMAVLTLVMVEIIDSSPLLLPTGEVVKSEKALLTDVEDGTLMQSADSVRFIVIHCSATREDRDYSEQQLLRDHRARKFRTVGYHFYIRRSGHVIQCRRLMEVGAHCRPVNRCSIGICYEGGLDSKGNPKDTRTDAQREQLQLLLIKLHRLFPHASILGHREVPGATPKACPCFPSHEYHWIEGI